MNECSKSWDAQFQEYFKKQIHPDVDTHIGRWVLERYNSYNPYSGVTNNRSKSLNCVIKDLQHWKEAPVDCMLLALYQLQAYYVNEIKRGIAGVGEYHLLPVYNSLQSDQHIVHYIPTRSPDEVVANIRNKGASNTPTATAEVKKDNASAEAMQSVFQS